MKNQVQNLTKKISFKHRKNKDFCIPCKNYCYPPSKCIKMDLVRLVPPIKLLATPQGVNILKLLLLTKIGILKTF